jgi:hypothetical protein
MKTRRKGSLSWKGAALLPLAAVVVHQLRYTLEYGAGAGHALTEQGHGYMTSLAPWIALVTAVGIGGLLGTFAQAWRGRSAEHGSGLSTLSVWVAGSIALIAIYTGQELLEGFFATGHPGGLGGVFGAGGWLAIPAAHAVAFVLALVLRGADALVLRVARRRNSAASRVPRTLTPTAPRHLGRKLAPLAAAAAGRAPPGALSIK